MFLVVYYDKSAKRVEVEDIESRSRAKSRCIELEELGAIDAHFSSYQCSSHNHNPAV